MRRIIFIVGLPGSGKTTLAKQLAREQGAELLDDFNLIVKGGDPRQALADAGDNIIITDPLACQVKPSRVVEMLEQWGGPCDVTFIAFENNLAACQVNIERRNVEEDIRLIGSGFLELLASDYHPEEWGEVRPVWTVDR